MQEPYELHFWKIYRYNLCSMHLWVYVTCTYMISFLDFILCAALKFMVKESYCFIFICKSVESKNFCRSFRFLITSFDTTGNMISMLMDWKQTIFVLNDWAHFLASHYILNSSLVFVRIQFYSQEANICHVHNLSANDLAVALFGKISLVWKKVTDLDAWRLTLRFKLMGTLIEVGCSATSLMKSKLTTQAWNDSCSMQKNP